MSLPSLLRDCVVIASPGQRQSGSLPTGRQAKLSNVGVLEYGKSSLVENQMFSYAWGG